MSSNFEFIDVNENIENQNESNESELRDPLTTGKLLNVFESASLELPEPILVLEIESTDLAGQFLFFLK